jgi:hypothetical protein
MRTFTVTIATPLGRLSVRLPTAEQAAERARQLAAEGGADVTISDPDGQVLPLAAFAERLRHEAEPQIQPSGNAPPRAKGLS